MWIDELQAELGFMWKERASLVFEGDRGAYYLAFELEAYGPDMDQLVLNSYDFFKQRDAIAEAFGKEWEAFLFEVQAGLRSAGFKVEITGVTETPGGRILKDPGYAKPPQPLIFTAADYENPVGQKEKLSRRELVTVWLIGTVISAAIITLLKIFWWNT